MFKREDYLNIIKIALFEFGFDTMIHVIMLIMVWDVLVHVILKEDVEKEGDDVLMSSIGCVGDRKDKSRTGRKDGSEAGKKEAKNDDMQEESLGESQGEGQIEFEEGHKDDGMVVVRLNEAFVCDEEVKLSLDDRVEKAFLVSGDCSKNGDYVMLDNVKYFGECSTSVIWSCYVVEGSCIETARLRYNKKIRGVRCRFARGTVKGLQGMAIFAKEDVGDIITIFKRLCKIKHK